MDSLEMISLTMTKLVEKEINQVVQDSPVKSPTDLDTNPSLGETSKKVLSK